MIVVAQTARKKLIKYIDREILYNLNNFPGKKDYEIINDISLSILEDSAYINVEPKRIQKLVESRFKELARVRRPTEMILPGPPAEPTPPALPPGDTEKEAKRAFFEGNRREAGILLLRMGIQSRMIERLFEGWAKEMAEAEPRRTIPIRPTPSPTPTTAPPEGEGQLSGKVTGDKEGDENGIHGAKVACVGPGGRGKAGTARDGSYIIQNLTPGVYRVGARARGYQSSRGLVEIRKGRVTTYDFKLSSKEVKGELKPKRPKWQLAIGPVVLAIIGLLLASLSGNMFFFFGFVFLGFYFLIPADEVNDLMHHLYKESNLRKRRKYQEELHTLLENRLLFRKLKWRAYRAGFAHLGMKEFSKFLAIAFFAMGFVTSAIPLAKPVGILLAFVGYFLIGGRREEEEEHAVSTT